MAGSGDIRILVVEDETLVRESIVNLLESLGYKIAGKAGTGVDGIRLAGELNPDIVFMDIKMPEMDGIKAAKEIMKTGDIPIVLLTAYESESLLKKASEAGVVSYLLKPPTTTEIYRAVTIALARHEDLKKVKQLNAELTERTAALEKALNEIHILRGILPICAHCKKVRNDEGYWEKVENYIEKNSDVQFSHGFCPDCQHALYGEYLDKEPGQGND
jgi:YesN/AraC family two-component response regulator